MIISTLVAATLLSTQPIVIQEATPTDFAVTYCSDNAVKSPSRRWYKEEKRKELKEAKEKIKELEEEKAEREKEEQEKEKAEKK